MTTYKIPATRDEIVSLIQTLIYARDTQIEFGHDTTEIDGWLRALVAAGQTS